MHHYVHCSIIYMKLRLCTQGFCLVFDFLISINLHEVMVKKKKNNSTIFVHTFW